MAQINVGTLANDHTGDPLRTAFQKINASMVAVYNVLSYGAIRGGPDCAAAVNAATSAAIAAGGGIVYFPAGQYWFTTSPTTLTGTVSVIWQGEGRNATYLVQAAAGVTLIPLGISCTRFFARDMWLGTFSNFATGGGVNATAAGYPLTPISEFGFENITFENLAYPVYLDNASQGWFRDCRYMQTRAGATVGHCFYMIRSVEIMFDDNFILTTTSTLPGDAMRVDSDCDTIMCWKCTHVLLGNGANTVGFHVMDSVGAGTHPPRIIQWYGGGCENGNVNFQIDMARDCFLNGFESANATTQGVLVNGGISVKILFGQVFLNQQQGIYIGGGSGVIVEGNTCSNNSQQTNGGYDAIVVASSDVRVINNRCGDIFFPAPTNKQRAGLNVTAGTDFVVIGGNNLQTNLGLGFEQPMTNTSTGQNNQIHGNGFVAASEAALVAGLDCKHIGGTIAIKTTLTAARLIGALSAPFIGQRAVFTFVQSGAGAFAVTWNAVYKVTWSDTGNTTGKRSSVAFVWDGTNWNQDGAQTPYV